MSHTFFSYSSNKSSYFDSWSVLPRIFQLKLFSIEKNYPTIYIRSIATASGDLN